MCMTGEGVVRDSRPSDRACAKEGWAGTGLGVERDRICPPRYTATSCCVSYTMMELTVEPATASNLGMERRVHE